MSFYDEAFTVFLTSSPCDNEVPEGCDLPCVFFERNAFLENLGEVWPDCAQFLIISAYPDQCEQNDEMFHTFTGMLEYHGFSLSDAAILDDRNREDAWELIREADVILLAGGHVPTEHAFFEEIGLKEALCFSNVSVIIGISAGSMNAAELVYAQPELEGESADPDYQRFLPGLGLTDINILPHYQMVKDYTLDGRRLYEDITAEDSYGREFLILVDGSYLLIDRDQTLLFGEAYRMADGDLEQICKDGEVIRLE